MDEESNNPRKDDAEKRIAKAFSQAVFRFGSITSFRDVAQLGLPHALAQKEDHYAQFIRNLAIDPEHSKIFTDLDKLNKEGEPDKFAELMTHNVRLGFQSAVDSASLVFAHSIIDSIAFDCCYVSARLRPEDWMPQIGRRTIELFAVAKHTLDEIMHEKLEKYLKQLERESLLKKIDFIHEKCPRSNASGRVENYSYDRERLEALDNLRHDVVHGEMVIPPLPNLDIDLEYIQKTCLYICFMILIRYNLKMDPDYLLNLK